MTNMKVLVLDNYDSFTYNLVHILRELGHEPNVCRNDKVDLEGVEAYDKILLSPGPGIPTEAGEMNTLIRRYGPRKSILGVCLGHQAIAEVYGASLFNLGQSLHGVTSKVRIVDKNDRLFAGLPESFRVSHYHSWAVERDSLGSDLRMLADNASGLVMALAHQEYDVRGVQFHPESVMSEHGKALVGNWLNETKN